MEKRLFTAIALSLSVVWLWSLVAPRPKSTKAQGKHPQTATKNKVVSFSADAQGKIPEVFSDEKFEIFDGINEKSEIIESEKLIVEFSNIGAAITNITIKGYDAVFPAEQITAVSGYEKSPFILEQISDHAVRYVYEKEGLRVIRSYLIHEDDYVVESNVEFQNQADMSKVIRFDSGGYLLEMSNLNEEKKGFRAPKSNEKSLMEYVVFSENGIHRKAGAFKFSGKEKKEEFGKIFWSCFGDRYFCLFIEPHCGTEGYVIDPVSESLLKVQVNSKDVTIPPSGAKDFRFFIYAGPEKTGMLKAYGFAFEKVKKYYRFGLFDGVAKIIDGLMHSIHKVVPNWGICIILISIIIYFSTYPLTIKGMKSMKKMQSLQPLIANLKEKHKDNPQKMNKEMM